VAFLLVDDCSSDETTELAAAYELKDGRVSYTRNERRLGLVGNWRRAFELARARYPDSPYFAWGSDHDVWDERWIERLVESLDRDDAAVLAYTMTMRIDASGTDLGRIPKPFDTAGVDSALERLRLSFESAPGEMVYGLCRASALERTGVLLHVIAPDRLTLAELSLHGPFRQVPEVLWRRRVTGVVSRARQRAAFFPGRRAPWHAYLPWWITHSFVLAWRAGVRGTARPAVGRTKGCLAAAWYAFHGARYVAERRLRKLVRKIRGRKKGRRS
jgi:glycosyltransferase involved in cell wall biosynthesis